MRTRKRVAGVALAALLGPSLAALSVVVAPPASADVTSPSNGTTYTVHTTVRIKAEVPASRTDSTLTLRDPRGGSQQVASRAGSITSGGTLAYDLQTDCATYPSANCSGRAPGPNGTWTVVLSGADSDTRTFVLRIPPRAPQSVTAGLVGEREVRVSWKRTEEPDLSGFTVREGSRAMVRVGLDACSGTSCSTVVGFGADDEGPKSFTVVAHRKTCPDCSGDVDGPASANASATLPPKPRPSPTQDPTQDPTPDPGDGGTDGGSDGGTDGGSDGGTDGGSDGGSDGGTDGGGTDGGGTDGGGTDGGSGGSGGSGNGSTGSGSGGKKPTAASPIKDRTAAVNAQRRAFALTFRAFSPRLGLPKLPPLPATGSAPAVAELPDGTYETTLGYEDQVVTEQVEETTAAARVRGTISSALDSERLAKSVAGALVLLLVAAHLRRWLSVTSAD